MKKILKIFAWTILVLLILTLVGGGLFVYKVKNGFPVTYETDAPDIDIPVDDLNVLLFSKTSGFRNEESIEAGKEIFQQFALDKGWFLYNTESAGVFNPEQLRKFDVVVFNNSTGRVLTDGQRRNLEVYVENGGKLIGIHGAGDDSHNWDWYTENLLGSTFSHHPLNPQLQEATISLSPYADELLSSNLPASWTHTDEWYVFFDNPQTKGFEILANLDGEKIIPNGNLLWIKDKNFGMGKDHPVAWFKQIGKGKTFYTSMGHDAKAWSQKPFIQMLENAILW